MRGGGSTFRVPSSSSTGNASLAAIDADLGDDGSSAPTLPGGSTGVRGWLRYLSTLLPTLVSSRWPVDGSGVTQPVSAASLPLPNGAATAAKQPALGIAGTASADVLTVQGASGGTALPVDIAVRTPSVTSIASSATSVTILASNASRRGLALANDSTSVLRLAFATPATSANAFVVMQPGQFLLLDPLLIGTGAIYGIWASANGTAQVTEWT